ncbi:probable N-acetyltransferase camello [Protopterus annectens]|uniref:probable N-acetyltransferase camello n=1 Tax=Protopterus annectens TaxID=7888 RepID=UPI001CFAC99F|nr:probable N-acetyltransferase camello [Protopterus annectens]
MASCNIRRYEDSDYETVRDIFTAGMSEAHSANVVYMLKKTPCLLGLFFVVCILFLSTSSFLLAVLGVLLLVVFLRHRVFDACDQCILSSLNSDMKYIRQSYLESHNSCFWVAESDGCIVGIVGCCPASETKEHLDLRRMSVLKTYRGRGIGKVLCSTVIDFGRQHGYKALVLDTSVVRVAAQKLYTSIGFKKYKETSFEIPLYSMVNLVLNLPIYHYRYDIPTVPGEGRTCVMQKNIFLHLRM